MIDLRTTEGRAEAVGALFGDPSNPRRSPVSANSLPVVGGHYLSRLRSRYGVLIVVGGAVAFREREDAEAYAREHPLERTV